MSTGQIRCVRWLLTLLFTGSGVVAFYLAERQGWMCSRALTSNRAQHWFLLQVFLFCSAVSFICATLVFWLLRQGQEMNRFSLQRALIGTAITAVGFGSASYSLNWRDKNGASDGYLAFLVLLYVVGWIIVGYGLGFPFRRIKLGVVLGVIVGFFVLLLWRFHPYSIPWWWSGFH